MTAASQAPAAKRALAVLRILAAAPGPMTASAIARSARLPRSTAYHLLAVMVDDGFVVHLPADRRYGLGVAAFEVGAAYLRHSPLEHQARPVLHRLVHEANASGSVVCHVAVLHGRESVYVLRESVGASVSGVIEVGVRLPATLTASGRAMLARLSREQVRALFPDAGTFVDRTGLGPMTPTALHRALVVERRQGWAQEDGFVVAGFSSVAAAVVDASERPIASIGATFRFAQLDDRARRDLAAAVMAAAAQLSAQVSGH